MINENKDSHSTRLPNTFMEIKSQTWQSHLQSLRKIRREPGTQGRTIYYQRLKRLTFFVHCRCSNTISLSIHNNRLPAFAILRNLILLFVYKRQMASTRSQYKIHHTYRRLINQLSHSPSIVRKA